MLPDQADLTAINDNEIVYFVDLPENRGASQIAGIIASLALAVFAPGIGTFLAAEVGLAGTTLLGISTASLLTTGVLIGGQTLISTFLSHPKPYAGTTSPSPSYTFNGGPSRARLGEANIDAGGRNMITCDLFCAPYSEFDANQVKGFTGGVVGVGEYDVEQIWLGSSLVWEGGNVTGSFAGLQIEVCGPADPVTLIEDNVATSKDIGQGVTLLGTNEEGYGWSGPFPISRPGAAALSVGIDIALAGLFTLDDSGHVDDASVSFEVQVQKLNNDGTTAGIYISILTQTITTQTRNAVRRSYRINLPSPGYWQARVQRTDPKSINKNTSDTLQWVGMRGYMPSIVNYPKVTKIAVIGTANVNLNGAALSTMKVVATRKLETITAYNPVTRIATWGPKIATRNPFWYAAYMLRDASLTALPDSRIDLDMLTGLAATAEARQDWFDGVFDSRKSLWENLQSVLNVARARPFIAGSSVSFVRDEPRTVPAAAFSPRNMLAGSFGIDFTFGQAQAVDALNISYIDNRTWSPNTLFVSLDDFEGEPESAPPVQWFGFTDRDHVWREGRYWLAQARYRRASPAFRTHFEGRACFLGSAVRVGHWLATWSTAASVIGLTEDETGDVLLLSEPWSVPQGKEAEDRLISISTPDGHTYGPVTFDLLDDGSDTALARVRLTQTMDLPAGLYAHLEPRDWGDWSAGRLELIRDDDTRAQIEAPRCMLGTASEQPQDCLLVSMKPQAGGKTAQVVTVVDDPRVHTADEADPPAEIGGPDSTLPADLTITSLTIAEGLVSGYVHVAITVVGAGDAISFDAHWKVPASPTFSTVQADNARAFTVVPIFLGVMMLEVRAKGVAGYGPWFPITLYADGTTDTAPADVGTISTDGSPSGAFVTGTVNDYTWAAVSGAANYSVQVQARRSGSGSFGVVRGPVTVTANAYHYYPADEIDDGGPWHNMYVQVKAKNTAGSSPDWTDSNHGT